MGKDLADRFSVCRELYERADAALDRGISEICFTGPENELTRSDNAQAAIFITSVACVTALREVKPDIEVAATAGLSLGEYSALHFAEVLGFEQTLKLLEARGEFMQAACEENPGAMVSAIGLDLPTLEEICKKSGAEIANINSPVQIVLSGSVESIDTAQKMIEDAGAKMAVRLKVAGAFHSSLMTPASAKLDDYLAGVDFTPASIPAYSNVTGTPHGDPSEIRIKLAQQVNSSVQWVKTIENMLANGVDTFIECGPGKVLTGLVKRIDKQSKKINIFDGQSLDSGAESI